MLGTKGRPNTRNKTWTRSGLARFVTDEKDGVAAIEFAMVVPIFLVLTMGMVNYGYTMYAKHSMQRVAGETLRAVVYGELSTSAAEDFATAQMEAAFGTFETGQLTPSVRVTPAGTEFVVSISVDTQKFDLVKFPPVTVSRYAPRMQVSNTGRLITRFNPST